MSKIFGVKRVVELRRSGRPLLIGTCSVEESEREEVETSLAAVNSAMESGAANSLKAAVQKLDSATEAAAARLVEKAMDEALDREMSI